MSTIQIVGIAAAAVVVLLLVIALVVTRKSGGERTEDVGGSEATTSFLDSSPSDTFAKLGRAEEMPPEPASAAPIEAPAAEPAGAAVVMTATGVAASAEGGLRLDWDQPEPPSPRAAAPAAVATPVPADELGAAGAPSAATEDDSEATGELPVIAVDADASGRVDEPPAEPEAGADDLVPLSSIIVTTSTKMVDLKDTEVRRMLTELVTFEIDQATQFRKNGQSLDAVLQLTEAEKICRALGKHDTAREIRDMMRELKD